MPADHSLADYRADTSAHLRTDDGANLCPDARRDAIPDASSHAGAADARTCYDDDHDVHDYDHGGADGRTNDGSTSDMPRTSVAWLQGK